MSRSPSSTIRWSASWPHRRRTAAGSSISICIPAGWGAASARGCSSTPGASSRRSSASTPFSATKRPGSSTSGEVSGRSRSATAPATRRSAPTCSTSGADSMSSRTVVVIAVGWLTLAIATGAAGIVKFLPPAPLVLFVLTAVVLVPGWLHHGFRSWLMTVDVRWLVALHLTRFVGFYFLYLYGRGELPYAFAVPGGWGDIVVATLAAALLMWGPPRGE